MAKYVQEHRESSASVVLQELKLKDLEYGAKPEQVRNWLKAYKTKKNIKAPYVGNPLDNLKLKLEDITKAEDWDGKDMHIPLLFPGAILLTGEDAEAHSKTLGHTKQGNKFYLAAVVSTPALCKLLWDQYFETEFATVEDITEDGLVLGKTQFPFLGADGNGKIVRSGVLYPLSTITKNHHGRFLGVGVSHNESTSTATDVLGSFKTGVAMILRKIGHDKKVVDEILDNIHILSDDATCLKKAVNQHLQKTQYGTESSCSAHMLIDGFPKNKPKLNNVDNYERFKAHITRLLKLPRSVYGDIPWRAI